MLAALQRPWWRAFLIGFALTLAFLALGLWQLGVVAAAIAGFLAGRGRAGAIRGIQSVGVAWFLWFIALSFIIPIDDVVDLLGGILGGGRPLVVLLMALVPVLMGFFGGLVGGYLAELATPAAPKAEAPPAAPPAGPAP